MSEEEEEEEEEELADAARCSFVPVKAAELCQEFLISSVEMAALLPLLLLLLLLPLDATAVTS